MKLSFILLAALTASTAFAQSEVRTKTPAADQNRNEIVKRFDKDEDGTLSTEEAAIARSTLAREKKTQPQQRDYKLAFTVKDPNEFKLEGGKEVFSGPQAGETLPKLKVSAVTGDDAGKTFNALGDHDGPQIIILSGPNRTSIRGIIGILRLVATVNENSKERLEPILVYLGDDKNQLAENANRYLQYMNGDPTIGVSNDGRDGPGTYGLNRNVSMTIIVATDGKVVYNFPFPEGMLTPDPHVLGAISEVIGTKPEEMRGWLIRAADERARTAATNERNRTGGVDIRALLAPVLDKNASDEVIDAAAKKIDLILEGNKAAATSVGALASRMVQGNLENYGTKRSQYHLFKWSRLYGVKPAASTETGN